MAAFNLEALSLKELRQLQKDIAKAISLMLTSLLIAAIIGAPVAGILLDLNLPGIKGQTLLKQLRGKNNDVPVLIISAQDKLQDVIENLNLGADDYLAKPFDIQELEARLR